MAQVNSGGVVSITVTVWLHVAVLPHASARQVRVTTSGQNPLVSVLRMVNVTFVPQQLVAVGGSKCQPGPQATTLFAGQLTTSGVAQGALHCDSAR